VGIEQLAFELSQARLGRQERMLDGLRSRAGILLGASSLAASFLGRHALADPGGGLLKALAVASFLVAMIGSISVLLPARNLAFGPVGSVVYERFHAIEGGMAEVHRRLAYDLDRSWLANDRQVRLLASALELAAAALVVEVLVLVALLVTTTS
jgi:hypothetical protein